MLIRREISQSSFVPLNIDEMQSVHTLCSQLDTLTIVFRVTILDIYLKHNKNCLKYIIALDYAN
ncbi:hypothetical protein BLOT_002925 [Blomia tropicalis]|nr:hypothetical protein BLOT_002925 [Blomia tropicalis]